MVIGCKDKREDQRGLIGTYFFFHVSSVSSIISTADLA